MEVDAVPNGLGPRFNLDSCSGCHSQPAVGGSSPPTNPQVALATAAGAKNTLPSFITATGPAREARFVRNPRRVAGWQRCTRCLRSLEDPMHQAAILRSRILRRRVANNNVIFRIPTPLFGLGLVENVPDTALQSSLSANAQQKRSLGISGHFNLNTNDQTIARFGWKAQNKSLLLFSGEAYNVEMGITNDLFQTEREGNANCQFNATPESVIPLQAADLASPAASFQSDIELFSSFMRLTAHRRHRRRGRLRRSRRRRARPIKRRRHPLRRPGQRGRRRERRARHRRPRARLRRCSPRPRRTLRA